jgi:polyisoprenoid-binding protein YceI
MEVSQLVSGHSIFFAALFVVTVPAQARAQHAQRMVLDSTRSEVWFEARSTGGDFTGRTRVVSAWIDFSGAEDFTAVRGEVAVDAMSFKTGIGLRDRHLRDEMGVARYPLVHLAVDSVGGVGVPDAQGERTATVFGRLTVREAQRPVQLTSFVMLRADTVQVRGSVPIRFTQFDMKPPSRLLGVARVRDDIMVHFLSFFVPAR